MNKLTLPLEVGKFYLTRDGRKARIYATDGLKGSSHQIHGAIFCEGNWMRCGWESGGEAYKAGGTHPSDLVSDFVEPRTEPFTFETWPVGAVVRYSEGSTVETPTAIKRNGLIFDGSTAPLQTLADSYLYAIPNGKPTSELDWKPCKRQVVG